MTRLEIGSLIAWACGYSVIPLEYDIIDAVWTSEEAVQLKGQVINAYVRRAGTVLDGMSINTFFYQARDIHLAAAQSPAPTTAPSYGFSISLPDGWVNVTRMSGGSFGVAAPERFPGVQVSMIWVESGKTAAQVYGSNFYQFLLGQRTFKDDAKLISDGDAVLKDGTLAYAYVYSGKVQSYWQKPENCIGKTLIVVAGGEKGFVITGFTTSDLYKTHEALIDEVNYSFHVE